MPTLTDNYGPNRHSCFDEKKGVTARRRASKNAIKFNGGHSVPFVDLTPLHLAMRGEFHEALDRVLFEDSLVFGASLQKFEDNFAKEVGADFCAGVSNGADALELIFRVILEDDLDEVIVPTNSFFASASAIALAGGTPVFCDVESNGLLCLNSVMPKVSKRTRAILAVHLYGQCVEMEPLLRLAKEKNLYLIEDAAQAHGARDNGKLAGALGHAAAFSFYPTKNLGALGDAGAVTSNDIALINRVKELRNYGSTKKYFHDSIGKNARMDSLQAAFLLVKLPHLQRGIERRRQIAARYLRDIADLPLEPIPFRSLDEHAFHLFALKFSGNPCHPILHISVLRTLSSIPLPKARNPTFVYF